MPSQTGEGPYTLKSAITSAKSLPWSDFFRSKALWAATAAHSSNNWGLYVSLAWLPTFFSSQYSLDLASSSYYSLLPYVAGAIASSGAGVAADKLIEGGMAGTDVRKVMQAVGSFGPMACMGALAVVAALDPTGSQGPDVSSSLFIAAVGLGAFSSAGFGTSLQDISGKYSGLLYGLTSIASSITGALGESPAATIMQP